MTTKPSFPLKGLIRYFLIYGGVIFFIYYQCTADDRDRDRRDKKEATREADIQQAINDGNFIRARKRASEETWKDDREKMYAKITRAQIAFLVNSGNIEQAYSIAQEENSVNVFFDAFMPALSDIYESVGKIKTLQYLVKVELSNSPDLSEKYITTAAGMTLGNNCGNYNDSAIKYNTLLEQFIGYVDIRGDREFATQLLRFVKPIVVELPKKGDQGGGVELSTQPQEDIKKKLGL